MFDGLEIGQHAAQPAVVDVKHLRPVGFFIDGFAGLFFGSHKQHGFALGGRIRDEVVGVFEQPDGFLQVHDIDPVARAENIRFHLGVPASRLVAEMHTRLQQLLHCHISHCSLLLRFGLATVPFLPASDFQRKHREAGPGTCDVCKGSNPKIEFY